jgi:hypothetical protein
MQPTINFKHDLSLFDGVFLSYIGKENCLIHVTKYQQLPDEIIFSFDICTEGGSFAPHLVKQLTDTDRMRLLDEYEVFFK